MNAISADELKNEKIRLLMKLRKSGITDTRVLGALEQIPRELFVTPAFIDKAYEDTALPIEQDQTISQPTVVAWMTQELEVSDRQVVLEVGTGSGYQTAVLSRLARRVHTIERHKKLMKIAEDRFLRMGLTNITAHYGDGYAGWSRAAPYERIIVTAAAPDLPETLVSQLAEGGIMIIPIGERDQQLMKIRKQDGIVQQEALMAVRFVPLVEGVPT